MSQEATQTKLAPTTDTIIAAYLTLRKQKEALAAKYNEEQTALKKKMDRLEAWLQIKMHADNVNSIATDAGTAYKSTVEKATVSDMDALLDYIKENEAWHLLEKRVSTTGVRAILEEQQALPPGVNWYTGVNINIRKPNER